MFVWLLVLTFMSQKINIQIVNSLNFDPDDFRCDDQFCTNVKCENAKDCRNGHIIEKSSFCKCCDICLKSLAEGEKCHSLLDGSLREITNEKCQAGLECYGGICQKVDPLTGCLKLKDVRENLVPDANSTAADHVWIPDCDIDGTFQAKQQKKRKSICVDKSGENIFGQSPPGLSENMTCGCSRHMLNLEKQSPHSFMTQPQEHCSSSGDFARVQCIGGLCYCADPVSGRMEDRMGTMEYMEKLPCYDKATDSPSYLYPCETELQRARNIRYGFFQKGVDVFGLERFKCDPDGTYSPVQRDSEEFVCTNKDGTRIGSFHYEIDMIEILNAKMTCNCARDTKGSDSESNYSTMRCEGWGNYKLFQCFHNNQCFCVDEDGDTISKQLSKENANQTVCLGLLNEISGKAGDVIATSLPTSTVASSSETDDVTSSEYIYDD